MKICFVDESGCTGELPSRSTNIQPVLSIVGMIVDYSNLHEVTERIIALKRRFYPGTTPTGRYGLDAIRNEIKGSEVRRKVCCRSRRTRTHAYGILDNTIKICKDVDAKLIGRVWVKGIGMPIDGRSLYTFSIQAVFEYFQHYLESVDDIGIVIADSRVKRLNSVVAHSIFTRKFRSMGDLYDRIVELPAFAHSDNHAGLQLADLVCSGIVTPMAIDAYCNGHLTSIHVRPGYARLRARYKADINAMQYRYQEANHRWRGGLTVADNLNQRRGGVLFS